MRSSPSSSQGRRRPSPWLEPALVALFGSAAWLSINGVWMQLPLMVAELPESWNLPSYLALIIQISCVVPLIYGLLKRCVKRLDHVDMTYGIMLMGVLFVLLSGLLALFWHHTAFVFDAERSVALFVIFFVISSVCTTTNVVWLPHLSRWRPALLGPFFVGLGVGALVPSLVGLAQGAGQSECLNGTVKVADNETIYGPYRSSLLQPRFSVGVYYGALGAWHLLSLGAFCLLAARYSHRYVKAPTGDESPDDTNGGSTTGTITSSSDEDNGVRLKGADAPAPAPHLPLPAYVCLLLVTAWVCGFMNAVLPSVMVYSCLPYGQATYHWALVLSNVANPIGCYLPSWVPLRRLGHLLAGTGLATVCCGYVLATAAMSPAPPGLHAFWGAALSVLSCTLAMLLLAHARTCAAGALRSAAGDSEARLFWCGASTQLGSFVAALVIFPLINVYGLFQTADVCPLPDGYTRVY